MNPGEPTEIEASIAAAIRASSIGIYIITALIVIAVGLFVAHSYIDATARTRCSESGGLIEWHGGDWRCAHVLPEAAP